MTSGENTIPNTAHLLIIKINDQLIITYLRPGLWLCIMWM